MTSIDIDEKLLCEAQELGHHDTGEAAVEAALTEYVRVLRQQQVLDLFGKIDYDPEYDYKAERRLR